MVGLTLAQLITLRTLLEERMKTKTLSDIFQPRPKPVYVLLEHKVERSRVCWVTTSLDVALEWKDQHPNGDGTQYTIKGPYQIVA